MSGTNGEELPLINKKRLIENHGRECIITRTEGRYVRAKGTITYDTKSDYLSIESENDVEDYTLVVPETGDEIEIDGTEYRVNLPE